MRMLEGGDAMRFRFETANEPSVPHQLGPDDPHGHLPTDRRLVGAVDHADHTPTDLLAKLEA